MIIHHYFKCWSISPVLVLTCMPLSMCQDWIMNESQLTFSVQIQCCSCIRWICVIYMHTFWRYLQQLSCHREWKLTLSRLRAFSTWFCNTMKTENWEYCCVGEVQYKSLNLPWTKINGIICWPWLINYELLSRDIFDFLKPFWLSF